MDGHRTKKAYRRAGLLLLAAVALANSGCLAVLIGAGAAGGAGVAYAYYQGNVTEDYHVRFEDSRAATRQALAELAMPIVEEKADQASEFIESRTTDGYAVRITLDMLAPRVPADGPLTRIGVRVGTFGDYAVSERVHRQIGAHLVIV